MNFATTIPGYSMSLELDFVLDSSDDVSVETIVGILCTNDGANVAAVEWDAGEQRARLADMSVEVLDDAACEALEDALDRLSDNVRETISEEIDHARWSQDAAFSRFVDSEIEERIENGYR
jgi:hypothetical protein